MIEFLTKSGWVRNSILAILILAGLGPIVHAALRVSGPVGSIGTALNVTNYGVTSSAADNATGLQAAINAAIANQVPLYIPAASSCYKYTAPLTINGPLAIRGDWASMNSAGGINYPLGTPPVQGSVLCPSSNGSDAITITGNSTSVDISDIGILFQTPFSGTGNGITYAPATQGLTGSHWRKVIVYGHDGNHYAFNLNNFIYDTFIDLQGFGGGGLNLSASSGALHYGNSTFIDPYFQIMAGGSAHGFNLSAGSAQTLNLMSFIRPQALSGAAAGVTPAPTSAQFTWTMDLNTQSVRLIAYDFESSVGSLPFFNTDPNRGNQFDYFGSISSTNTVQAPAWTTNGIIITGQAQNLTDTTSSGTVPLTAVAALPSDFVGTTSATTMTDLVTLLVPSPHNGPNVTATNIYAIEATGPVKFPALTVTGTSSFNQISTTGTASLNGNATVGGTLGVTSTASLNGQSIFGFNESGYTYGVAGSGTYIGRNCSNGGNQGCLVGVGGLNLYAAAASSTLASTTPPLQVNTNNVTVANGIISGGTKPTVTGCSNSTTLGGVTAGSYVSGTTGTCTVTITLPTGPTNGYACFAHDDTTAVDFTQSAIVTSTTTLTISGTTVSGDKIVWACPLSY